MSEELKPCPFCGGKAVIEVIEPHRHIICKMPVYKGGAFIECTECGCAISGETETEATEKWNRRMNDPEKVVKQLEEYRSEMEQFGCDGILTDMIEIVKGGGTDADQTDFVQYRDGSGDSGRKKELYKADYETTTYSTLWNAVCDDKIINVN